MSLTERDKAWLLAASEFRPQRDIMNHKRKHTVLGPDKNNANYAWQDGHIYAWSESGFSYQRCWWLTTDGEPVVVDPHPKAEHVANLLRDRPFDPDWLKDVVPPG